MAERFLILGGTREATLLADRLAEAGHEVILSLAGRGVDPPPTKAKLRVGGFGGPEGLVRFLSDNQITRLIDATHPFAHRISGNAIKASEISGIAVERLERPPWRAGLGDHWSEFPDLKSARDALPPGARAFLALGSQHIDIFAARKDVHFIVRMASLPPRELPFASYDLIIGRPGATPEEEQELFAKYDVSHVVCRNSGGRRGYAKIEAARRMSLPVFMITRRQ